MLNNMLIACGGSGPAWEKEPLAKFKITTGFQEEPVTSITGELDPSHDRFSKGYIADGLDLDMSFPVGSVVDVKTDLDAIGMCERLTGELDLNFLFEIDNVDTPESMSGGGVYVDYLYLMFQSEVSYEKLRVVNEANGNVLTLNPYNGRYQCDSNYTKSLFYGIEDGQECVISIYAPA